MVNFQQQKLQKIVQSGEIKNYPFSELLETFPNALNIYSRFLTGEDTATAETVEAVRQALLQFCDVLTEHTENISRLVAIAKCL